MPARRPHRGGPRRPPAAVAPAPQPRRRPASGRARSAASCAGPSSACVAVAGAADPGGGARTSVDQHRRRGRHDAAGERCSRGRRFEMLAAGLLGRRDRTRPDPARRRPGSAANRAEIAAITKAIAGDPIFGTPTIEPGASARGAVLDVPINADANSTAATRRCATCATSPTCRSAATTSQNIDYFDISSQLPADRRRASCWR